MLVIFDCDGVLVSSERIVERVEAAFLTAAGFDVTPDQARTLFKGRPFAEVAHAIERAVPRPLPPVWVYELAMATALAFHDELTEVPGVRALLETLRERGVPVCTASQSLLPRVQLSLRICRLESFFGTKVFSSSLVERPKPAPDLFLYAAREMAAPPATCVVIEDSPSGVVAAVAAGMKVLGYAGDEDEVALRHAGAITFKQMSEVPALLGLA